MDGDWHDDDNINNEDNDNDNNNHNQNNKDNDNDNYGGNDDDDDEFSTGSRLHLWHSLHCGHSRENAWRLEIIYLYSSCIRYICLNVSEKNKNDGIIRRIPNTPDKADEVSGMFDESLSSQSRTANGSFSVSLSFFT